MKIFSIFFIGLGSLLNSVWCMNPLSTVTVKIQQGILRGRKYITDHGTDYYMFLGIPYAKPPVGDLRFQVPQSPESWEGERDATATSNRNISVQLDFFSDEVLGSEDCLYLNVHTPKINDNSGLMPVMVWIHAGGFIFGNGILENEIEPEPLVGNGVVLVKINYRLNIFGFLSLDIIEAAGNMGLKDQIKALEWIQNNIVKFGGDKNRVTIFGDSAGSASVDFHLLSPLSKGLFHGAILHSGSTLNHWAINYEPNKIVLKLLNQLGYNESLYNKQAIHEYLLHIPAPTLIRAAMEALEQYTKDRIFFGFVPTIEKDFKDGTAFLTSNPSSLLKRGDFNHVPVIKGFCNREGYMTQSSKPGAFYDVVKNKKFMTHWPYKLDVEDVDQYEAFFHNAYVENSITNNDESIAFNFFGDLDFASGIWLSGKLMAKQKVPVYFYQFAYEGTLKLFSHLFKIETSGASHADDTLYILNSGYWNTTNVSDILVRKRMTKMWSNFAKTSCPTKDDTTGDMDEVILTQWPKYEANSPAYMLMDKDFKIIKSEYEPKKMEIYEKILMKYEKYN